MNYQPDQQPQWPQPGQPQNGNQQTQEWAPQSLNMPPIRQFQRPQFQSLSSRQLQQSQYNFPPVSNYAFTQQQPPYLKQQLTQTKTNQVKPGFFSKKVEIPLWALILVVGVIFILNAVILGSGSILKTSNTPSNTALSGTTVTPSSIPTTLPTATPTPIPTPIDPAKVGGTITVNNISCTLVSVEPIPSDEIYTPKAGNEYIVVRVKLFNNGNNEVYYNPLDFHIKSGTGDITDTDFATPQSYTANDILDSGNLAVGGTVEGDLIMQAPIGDHKAELTWQPNFYGDTSNIAWLLGL